MTYPRAPGEQRLASPGSRAKLTHSDAQGGDAMHEENSDAVCVDAWLRRVAPNSHPITADSLLQLFERALDAVWREAAESLGEVTLTAIATRVIFMSKERFPGLSGISIKADGISLDDLRERAGTSNAHDLREPLCFLLIELLRVLGDLTANVLTPWLQAELSKIALEDPARTDADNEPVPVHPVSPEGEEA